MSDVKVVEQVRMCNEWVFVEPIEEKDVYGNLVIPETAKDVTQKGLVVTTSSKGDKNIKVGDVVLFRRNAGFKHIELNGKRLNVMRKEQVLGVVFGDNAWDVNALAKNVFLDWEQAQSEYEALAGGSLKLVRPEGFREMHYTGNVLSVGPDVVEVAVGDRVFFDQFCGLDKFQEDGRRFAFLREGDIYCKVPKREVAA